MIFARVALPVPHKDFFTYRVPEPIEGLVRPGTLVTVPFRDQSAVGVIWEIVREADSETATIREISGIGDSGLEVSDEIRCLVAYTARRYVTTPGMVLKSVLPPGTLRWGKLYFYPGQSRAISELASHLEHFANLISDQPGKFSFADIPKLGVSSRKDVEGLVKKGIIAISPFKAERTSSHRGKEKWIRAVDGAVTTALGRTAKPFALRQMLLENSDGIRLSALADYGHSPAAASSLVKKGLAEYFYRDKRLAEIGAMKSLPKENNPVLTLWQQSAVEKIIQAINDKQYKGILLYGVTSSGKTQVYLEAAKHALSLGCSVLVLVPEISLTPQIISRFERFLGQEPLVWHSHLSPTERLTIYRAAKAERGKLLIGTRSAIFSPLPHLGLVVIDEEQDHSYKQDDPAPRYNARDLAIARGKLSGAVVVLGSATPSVESYFAAKCGELEMLTLPQRVAGSGNPEVQIISTAFKPEPGPKDLPVFPRGFRPISEKLYEEITIRLKKKEQVIILLNRRGYSSAVVCFDCGWVGKCPDCEIGWTYHKTGDRMICHYCGRQQRGPSACAKCGSSRLSFRSAGTQRLEETLRKILPKASAVRLDTDVASGKWEARNILDDFGRGKYRILLGTQMVAKGHHFPHVGLVGIISADIGLSLPDFRATEHVLQLLTQAAGRAGRSSKRSDHGLVIIQTFSPENPIFAYLNNNDFVGFLDEEIKIRRTLNYPPFKRLVLIVISSRGQVRALEGASQLKDELSANAVDNNVEILGPVESPVFKHGKLFRYQLLIKIPPELEPREILYRTDDFAKHARDLIVRIDVDPVSFM